tara:strand:- start:1487 stop:1711 length:225 start_codon:yes stop_codon:yes gene_type:complete
MSLTIETSGSDINGSDTEIAEGVDAALAYASAHGLTVAEMMADDGHRAQAEFRALDAAFAGWMSWPESAQLVNY